MQVRFEKTILRTLPRNAAFESSHHKGSHAGHTCKLLCKERSAVPGRNLSSGLPTRQTLPLFRQLESFEESAERGRRAEEGMATDVRAQREKNQDKHSTWEVSGGFTEMWTSKRPGRSIAGSSCEGEAHAARSTTGGPLAF